MNGGGERIGGGDGEVGMLSAGLVFSGLRERMPADPIGGTKVIWTGVIPLPIGPMPKLAPPQKTLAPILGEIGKSFCVLATASFFFCSGGECKPTEQRPLKEESFLESGDFLAEGYVF